MKHISEMPSFAETVKSVKGVGRIFSSWGPIVDFSRHNQKYFFRGAKSGKILFYHPKLRKRPVFAKN